VKVDDDIEFEWDIANLGKLASSGRGVTPDLCKKLSENNAKFFPETRENKSGDYWMIAPDDTGRMWTIVVVFRGGNLWRPISGWPSTNSQVRRYYEEG
jgi:hypothetical protein